MTETHKPRRTRLVPEARRQLILDAAAQIVTVEGLSAVNMDRLGREAGVSKALVYNYFPNRIALLRALLLREVQLYQDKQRTDAARAHDMDTFIRVTTRAYLDHIADKGVLIQRLMNEPAIAAVMEDRDRADRQRTVAFLASRIREGTTMPDGIVHMMIELGLGLTGAAGAYLDKTGCNIDLLEDMLVSMIQANIAAVEAHYRQWRQVETALAESSVHALAH